MRWRKPACLRGAERFRKSIQHWHRRAHHAESDFGAARQSDGKQTGDKVEHRATAISRLAGGHQASRDILSYEPLVSFEEGLRRTVEWYAKRRLKPWQNKERSLKRLRSFALFEIQVRLRRFAVAQGGTAFARRSYSKTTAAPAFSVPATPDPAYRFEQFPVLHHPVNCVRVVDVSNGFLSKMTRSAACRLDCTSSFGRPTIFEPLSVAQRSTSIASCHRREHPHLPVVAEPCSWPCCPRRRATSATTWQPALPAAETRIRLCGTTPGAASSFHPSLDAA